MGKKTGNVFLAATCIGGLIVANILWGWTGILCMSLILLVSAASAVLSGKIRKKQDHETERKYGVYGEVETNNYPSPHIHDSETPTDERHT